MSESDRFLLDTNIVVELVRGGAVGQWVNKTYGLDGALWKPSISIVTYGEILSLAEQFNWGDRKRQIMQNLLGNFVTIDISSSEILDAYAELDVVSHRHRVGSRNMGKNDLWIAATARATSMTLISSDRDFEHLHPGYIQFEYVDKIAIKQSSS